MARIQLVVQGHRGARGLRPENTLPSFETAMDVGATSIETDVHLTRDGVPVLVHDPVVSERLFRPAPVSGPAPPALPRLVRSLTLAELRGYWADRNPDPARFAEQIAVVTPLAASFATTRGIYAHAVSSVDDFIEFVAAYAGELGTKAGKTPEQQARAQRLRFDLELKRVPFHPETIGDGFDGETAGLLEQRLVDILRAGGVVERTTVRSFDHRCVRAIGRLEPRLTLAVLVAGTAPINPVALARDCGASAYCPEYTFLDAAQVQALHAAQIGVLPWTVNEPDAWTRLLEWGVEGITTDCPDRLAAFLKERGLF
jgi:glycerophosphoryl diester phosphodiesterase